MDLTHGTVYSSHDRVNVILPGTGPKGEGNHFYPPAHGKVVDYIRGRIIETIESHSDVIGWANDTFIVAVYATHEAGIYTFSVWK